MTSTAGRFPAAASFGSDRYAEPLPAVPVISTMLPRGGGPLTGATLPAAWPACGEAEVSPVAVGLAVAAARDDCGPAVVAVVEGVGGCDLSSHPEPNSASARQTAANVMADAILFMVVAPASAQPTPAAPRADT